MGDIESAVAIPLEFAWWCKYGCDLIYDVRLYGSKCPVCQSVKSNQESLYSFISPEAWSQK